MKTPQLGYRKELTQLESRALNFLHEPAVASGCQPRQSSPPELVLWHYPSFADYRSWGVFRTQAGKTPRAGMICEVRWKRGVDYERFHDPLVGLSKGMSIWPTIELRDAELSDDLDDVLFGRLSKLALPVWPDPRVSPFGTDGERFGIQCGNVFHGLKIEWWQNGPPAWKELIDWAAESRRLLIKSCAAAKPRILLGESGIN